MEWLSNLMTMDWVSPQTLMWLQIATGFVGALTLVYWKRWLGRKLGSLPSVAVHFSPRGGCQDALVRELQAARHEILVQAYAFTAAPLTAVLVEAKKRGVHVEIVLDRGNESERFADLKTLLDQGLHPLIDGEHSVAHNKVIVIDQRVVVTGSYNFTTQAEADNAENLVVLKGLPEVVKRYRDNFLAHKAHSKPAELKPVSVPMQRRAA
jgi:phosphatidylserine/phosphatidylglycerophosphate/cardiolipin synthase-like enzyme